MRARFTLFLTLAVLASVLAPRAGAESPTPEPGNGLHVARPRAAVLSVFDGAAESFLDFQPSDDASPIRLPVGPSGGPIVLYADYETTFMPLTAGWGEAALTATLVTDGTPQLLGHDDARVVAFGPTRKAGRLTVAFSLPPGLHRVEVDAAAAARPVGVADWTTDHDTLTLWILVAGGMATVSTTQQSATAAAISGLYVGAQRGAASASAAGAINFETGDGALLEARVGQPVTVWSDYGLWWSEGASGEGRAWLGVLKDATDVANATPLASDVVEPVADPGPRLADGVLKASFSFDAPGTFPVRARLATRIRSGDLTREDTDDVRFRVHVVADPPPTGAISGRVRADLQFAVAPLPILPLAGVSVVALNDDGRVAGKATTGPRGLYRMDGLAPGKYLVRADPGSLNYLGEWYDNQPNRAAADPVEVVAGAESAGIDFALTPGASIMGRITDAQGQPLPGITVDVGRLPSLVGDPAAPDPVASGREIGTIAAPRARTNEDGYYSVDQLPAGRWWVRAQDPQGRYLMEFYDDRGALADADPVVLASGEAARGIDFVLAPGGGFRGHVTAMTAAGARTPLARMLVEARDPSEPEHVWARAVSNADGAYEIGGLAAGRYLARASDPDGRLAAEWYLESSGPEGAQPVPVTPGAVTPDIDFTLERADTPPRVFIDPPVLGLRAGDTGTFAVAVDGVENLGAFEAALGWDPAVFEVDSVELGPFLGSTGRRVIPVDPVVDNDTGRLRFAAASLGDAPGASGAGPLFLVHVSARNRGETEVSLRETTLTDPGGNALRHATVGGKVSVGQCMRGDFDCNCVIDIRDMMAVILHWGTSAGDPDFDAVFDLDADQDVDIVDVQIEASLWGRTCALPERPASPPRQEPIERQPGLPDLEPARAGDRHEAFSLAGAGLGLRGSVDGLGIGDTFEVNLAVAGAADLAGFEATLRFDPTVLEVDGVALGSLLTESGRTFVPLGPEPTAAGGVRIGAYSFPGGVGPSGDGVVASVTIRVLAEGSGTLVAGDVWLVSSTGDITAATGDALSVEIDPSGSQPGAIYLPFVEASAMKR